MSMAKIILKAAKAIIVVTAATAVGYAGYKTVKESVDAAKGYEHIIPRKNVYNFEGLIVDRRTNNARRVGCEANDKVDAHLKFRRMCDNEFEYCEYESIKVTDFPDDYVKEGKTEFGEEKHYGTAEEYERDAEYAMTPPTKKERRTVFFKQLGISSKEWFLNEDLIGSLLFSATGLVALRLGTLCGRALYRDELAGQIKKSASEYGCDETTPYAVKLASWLCDGVCDIGEMDVNDAVVFGVAPSGNRYVSNCAHIENCPIDDAAIDLKFERLNV